MRRVIRLDVIGQSARVKASGCKEIQRDGRVRRVVNISTGDGSYKCFIQVDQASMHEDIALEVDHVQSRKVEKAFVSRVQAVGALDRGMVALGDGCPVHCTHSWQPIQESGLCYCFTTLAEKDGLFTMQVTYGVQLAVDISIPEYSLPDCAIPTSRFGNFFVHSEKV